MKTSALLSLLSLFACAHHIGDVCAEGDAFCGAPDAPKTALVCKDGKLVSFNCPGPRACSMDASRSILCDQSSGAMAGDLCFPQYNGTGHCSSDSHGYLFCASGQWKEVLCPKDEACVNGLVGISCQTPLPQVK